MNIENVHFMEILSCVCLSVCLLCECIVSHFERHILALAGIPIGKIQMEVWAHQVHCSCSLFTDPPPPTPTHFLPCDLPLLPAAIVHPDTHILQACPGCSSGSRPWEEGNLGTDPRCELGRLTGVQSFVYRLPSGTAGDFIVGKVQDRLKA